MKINCLTLLETIQDLNEFIQHGKELPSWKRLKDKLHI
jgi:hypothetical protein